MQTSVLTFLTSLLLLFPSPDSKPPKDLTNQKRKIKTAKKKDTPKTIIRLTVKKDGSIFYIRLRCKKTECKKKKNKKSTKTVAKKKVVEEFQVQLKSKKWIKSTDGLITYDMQKHPKGEPFIITAFKSTRHKKSIPLSRLTVGKGKPVYIWSLEHCRYTRTPTGVRFYECSTTRVGP